MRVHFDVLGWLHSLWGLFGVLTGIALGIIALGSVLSVNQLSDSMGPFVPSVILLIIGGLLLGVGGLVMMAVGHALRRRSPGGRLAALAFALPTLAIVPFGTALGLYTYWTLLNDDARQAFGRPTRASHTIVE
jgi:hypothetical protein